ncbi:MAG: hypothetical protein IPL69_19745 [Saprospiraceae bacterium]|nr:hypothetical protein [Candidatus Brachybacter algidus]
MKKNILFLIGLFLAFGYSNAQDKVQDLDQTRIQEHLMLRDGSMYLIKDQDQKQLKEQMRLQNGTMVNRMAVFRFKIKSSKDCVTVSAWI